MQRPPKSLPFHAQRPLYCRWSVSASLLPIPFRTSPPREMKLRVRSMASKETLRVDAPNACSVLDLKALIAAKLSSSSAPPIAAETIRLSLNRTDELLPSSPHDPLPSLGLTSGDLLFYSLSPFPQTLAPTPAPPTPSLTARAPMASQNLDSIQPLEKPFCNTHEIVQSQEPIPPRPQDLESMEVDAAHVVREKAPIVERLFKKVMDAENGEAEGILGRLVIAIHAAFLDSGFVVSNGLGSLLPQGWSSSLSSLSIRYTVPQIVGWGAKDAVLKFSLLGNYVTLYGYLAGEHPDVYRACLDASNLAPLFSSDTLSQMQEAGALELWKVLKDGLCLPLLIDICLDNRFPLPPCFMGLSADLKMKILEFIPGLDVARIGCTCSELKFLSSNESLWKKKFEQEFVPGESSVPAGSWRERYARAWLAKKKVMEDLKRKNFYFEQRSNPVGPHRSFHPVHPQMFPMIGGNYDWYPAIGMGNSQGPSIRNTRIRIPARQSLSPDCHLGGYNIGFRG